MYYPTKNEDKTMINLVMQPLMEQVEEVVLQILILPMHFLIYLVRIFLMIFSMALVEVEGVADEDNPKIEVRT
jgi:hypothetical protein